MRPACKNVQKQAQTKHLEKPSGKIPPPGKAVVTNVIFLQDKLSAFSHQLSAP
jgi:hypothetical protein